MNLKTAAQRLGVHYQTAYRLVQSGALVAVKIGNRYEISEAAVERAARRIEMLARAGEPPGTTRDGRRWTAPLDDRESALAVLDEATARVAPDATPVLALVARSAVECLGDVAFVFLRSRADGSWRLAACDHAEPGSLAFAATIGRIVAPRDGPTILDGVAASAPLLAKHIRQDRLYEQTPAEFHESLRELGLHTALAATLGAPHDPRGVICVLRGRTSGPYQEADLAFVQELAARGARAVEAARRVRGAWEERARLRARLYRQVRHRDASPPAWCPSIPVSHSMVLLSRPGGAVVAANEMFCRATGYEAGALVGRPVHEIVAATPRSAITDRVGALAATDLEFRDHAGVVVRADGSLIRCTVHQCVISLADGTPVVVLSVLARAVGAPAVDLRSEPHDGDTAPRHRPRGTPVDLPPLAVH
jgi:excisionase family DNA binding protein/PAS domain S-box-containing protein